MILVDYDSWEAEYLLNVAPPTGSVMDLETAKKSLETKLTLLQLNMTRTDNILQGEQPDAIERHHKALKAVIIAVDDCRRAVEEQKIIAKKKLRRHQWLEQQDQREVYRSRHAS